MARILIVDDDEQVRNLMQVILTHEGYEVETAENGKTGLAKIRLWQYDLLITDVIMPEKDGFEVLMEVRQLRTNIRVILMTGGSARLKQQDVVQLAQSFRPDLVMEKPLDFDLLKSSVASILRLKPETTGPEHKGGTK